QRQLVQGEDQETATVGGRGQEIDVQVVDLLRDERGGLRRDGQHRLACTVAAVQVPQLHHETVAGAGGQDVQVLLRTGQHAHEGRARRRGELARQRLALASRGGQGVRRRRVGPARRVQEDHLL